jgi:hypothetical protein
VNRRVIELSRLWGGAGNSAGAPEPDEPPCDVKIAARKAVHARVVAEAGARSVGDLIDNDDEPKVPKPAAPKSPLSLRCEQLRQPSGPN